MSKQDNLFIGRVLRMYKNSIHQKAGPDPRMFEWMRYEYDLAKISPDGSHGILSFDEMKIQVINFIVSNIYILSLIALSRK